MENRLIEQRRDAIIARAGAWTAHNIHLGNDTYTFAQTHPNFEQQLVGHGRHLQRIVQAAADVTGRPLRELRVLDLACLEGLYGLEFARHGAQVVGIEIRDENIEKARFAQEALALDNIDFVQDDVRNLSVARYGEFDVVLCLGIFYHLDAPAVFHFAEQIAAVCRRVAIIDTHVGLRTDRTHTYAGRTYYGHDFVEHAPQTTEQERRKALWASIDNEHSLWLSRPSLFNLLADVGFTSSYTCQNPVVPGQYLDRDTIVAIKGTRVALKCTPPVNELPDERWPEQNKVGVHPGQQQGRGDMLAPLRRVVSRLRRR